MYYLPFLPAAYALFFRGASKAATPCTSTERPWRPARLPRTPGWAEARRRRYGHPDPKTR